MNKANTKNSFINKFLFFFKKYLKSIISIFLFLLLIIIFYQYFIYQKEQKVLKLSKIYDQVDSNFNSSEFEEKLNIIAKENGIFGILASLELINESLKNNDYSYAYIEYLKLLESRKSKKVYNSIIALHGAYNLIDYIPLKDISNLLSFVDESSVYFIGYKSEILYLLSVMNNDLDKSNELLKNILNNENISEKIKERVKKINEFEKYQ